MGKRSQMSHNLIPTSADYCAMPGGCVTLKDRSCFYGIRYRKNVFARHVQRVTPIPSLTANTIRATSDVPHVPQVLPH